MRWVCLKSVKGVEFVKSVKLVVVFVIAAPALVLGKALSLFKGVEFVIKALRLLKD